MIRFSVVLRPIKMFASILDMSFAVSNLGTFGVTISVWMTWKWIWLYYNLWYFKTMVTLQLDYLGKMILPEMKRIEYCPPCMIVCHLTYKIVDLRFFNVWHYNFRGILEASLPFRVHANVAELSHVFSPPNDHEWFNIKSWQFYFVSANYM